MKRNAYKKQSDKTIPFEERKKGDNIKKAEMNEVRMKTDEEI